MRKDVFSHVPTMNNNLGNIIICKFQTETQGQGPAVFLMPSYTLCLSVESFINEPCPEKACLRGISLKFRIKEPEG